MSVTAGTVWRPTVGNASKVVVMSVGPSGAVVEPWPPKARRKPARTTIRLTADGITLVGYTATGQKA